MRTPRISELLSRYAALAAGRVAPRTARNNARCVTWIFGAADPPAKRERLRPLVLRWQRAWLKRAPAGDREALARAVVSGQSICRQAASVFTRRLVEAYQSEGWRVEPDLRTVFLLDWPRARLAYRPVDAEVFQAAWTAAAGWPADVRLAFYLALGGGLRASELLRLRTDQLRERDGRVWLAGVPGKDGGLADQPLLAPCDALVAALWPRKAPGRVFTAANVIRRLNGRLRAIGWGSAKGVHELRSLAICRAGTLWGLDGARLFARHADPRMTWAKYGRYLALFGAHGIGSIWPDAERLADEADVKRFGSDTDGRSGATPMFAQDNPAVRVNGDQEGAMFQCDPSWDQHFAGTLQCCHGLTIAGGFQAVNWTLTSPAPEGMLPA
jgi:integrase